MRGTCLVSAFATLLFASLAYGQNQPRGQQPPFPAKAGPYKVVSVTPPQAINDATFEAFRKQMNEAAQSKDRAALAKLVVGNGFFWLRETGDRADKSKSGVGNLAAALRLNSKDGAGWDMLASFADDPTGSPLPERKGALCAPADPAFDGKAFNNLMQATQTDVGDWACPVTRDVEVRALPRPNAPVIEKLGMVLHRPAGSVMCWWTPWLRSAMTRSAASRTRVGGRSVVISAVATHNRHEI